MELIQSYLEVYEHTCEPLEQMKIITEINELLVERPRLDFEVDYFIEAFKMGSLKYKYAKKLIDDIVRF